MPLNGGQTRTGPEREQSRPEGGNRGADGSEAGQRKIQHEIEDQPPVGGNRNAGRHDEPGSVYGNADTGLRRNFNRDIASAEDADIVRRDSVREVGSEEVEEEGE